MPSAKDFERYLIANIIPLILGIKMTYNTMVIKQVSLIGIKMRAKIIFNDKI